MNCTAESIQQAQQKYKNQYDKKGTDYTYQRSTCEVSPRGAGRDRKLSHPWHSPYRIIDVWNADDGSSPELS